MANHRNSDGNLALCRVMTRFSNWIYTQYEPNKEISFELECALHRKCLTSLYIRENCVTHSNVISVALF